VTVWMEDSIFNRISAYMLSVYRLDVNGCKPELRTTISLF